MDTNQRLTNEALAALVDNLHGYVDISSLLHQQVMMGLRELQQWRAMASQFLKPQQVTSNGR